MYTFYHVYIEYLWHRVSQFEILKQGGEYRTAIQKIVMLHQSNTPKIDTKVTKVGPTFTPVGAQGGFLGTQP